VLLWDLGSTLDGKAYASLTGSESYRTGKTPNNTLTTPVRRHYNYEKGMFHVIGPTNKFSENMAPYMSADGMPDEYAVRYLNQPNQFLLGKVGQESITHCFFHAGSTTPMSGQIMPDFHGDCEALNQGSANMQAHHQNKFRAFYKAKQLGDCNYQVKGLEAGLGQSMLCCNDLRSLLVCDCDKPCGDGRGLFPAYRTDVVDTLVGLLEPLRDNVKGYYSRDVEISRDAVEDYPAVRFVFGGGWAALHKPSKNKPSMSYGASTHGNLLARTALALGFNPRDLTSNEVLETQHAYDNKVHRYQNLGTPEAMEEELHYCIQRREYDKKSAADRNAGRKLNRTGEAAAMKGMCSLPKNHETSLDDVPAVSLVYGPADTASLNAAVGASVIPDAVHHRAFDKLVVKRIEFRVAGDAEANVADAAASANEQQIYRTFDATANEAMVVKFNHQSRVLKVQVESEQGAAARLEGSKNTAEWMMPHIRSLKLDMQAAVTIDGAQCFPLTFVCAKPPKTQHKNWDVDRRSQVSGMRCGAMSADDPDLPGASFEGWTGVALQSPDVSIWVADSELPKLQEAM
jgi:hypothetical protein